MNGMGVRGFFRRVLSLGRKEFLIILKDPANRVVLFGPVLVQSLLFGYAATFDLNNIPYALLDQSRSAASHELVSRLDGSGVFRRVATLGNASEIAELVNTQQVLLAIQIGPRFEAQLRAGEVAPIQAIVDARNSTTAGNVVSYLGSVVRAFNDDWWGQHGGVRAPLTLLTRAWYNPNLETRWNLLPALIATLSMLQTLLLTALSVAREREQGTFDQLLVTPSSPVEILIGKAVPSIMVGLTQSSIVLLLALFWFRIPMAGSLLALYTALGVFTVACVGLGLSISALAANMQQAMLYAFMLAMPMVLLSGMITPIRNMPQFLQHLTMANPVRFGVNLVQRIYLEGADLGTLVGDLMPLMVIAAVALPLAGWLFRNRLI
jgi:ABC-2 type transport system permease protein